MNDTPRHFMELIHAQWEVRKHLCIGLDTDVSRIPEALSPELDAAARLLRFNEIIIDSTCDLVCAYKPNIAFYEALGPSGLDALEKTIDFINHRAPEVPVIVDAKRADIGNTNEGYVTSLFDHLGADAVTVHPYLGREALLPFLQRRDKGIFVLVRTSNPGAGEFQDLVLEGTALYLRVAHAVATKWNDAGNCGLVVGATYPRELRQIRETVREHLPILVPGVGTQGGDLTEAVLAGQYNGKCALIINASRSILFASQGEDFEEKARAEARRLSDEIASALAS